MVTVQQQSVLVMLVVYWRWRKYTSVASLDNRGAQTAGTRSVHLGSLAAE